jgi:hypothetical protein
LRLSRCEPVAGFLRRLSGASELRLTVIDRALSMAICATR